MTRKTICLLGASFNTGNMGVSVLAAGAIRAATTHFPDAEILFLDYCKSEIHGTCRANGRDIPYRLVNLRFSKNLWLGNHVLVLIALSLLLRLIPSKRLRAGVIARNRWLAELERVDIFASLAGGDSFSDIYGFSRLFYVSLPQILVLALGKPLCLLPQTLGPLDGRLARMIARFIFRRSTLIYSRDEGLASVQAMLNPRDKSKVRFCYDVGFVVTPHPPASEVTSRLFRGDGIPVVGVNVSGLLFQNVNGAFGLQVGYRELVRDVIAMFIEQQGARVVIFPHVYGHDERSESDSPVCKRLYEELRPKYNDRISLVSERYAHDEMKYLIGRCDFFVGSRMHACIAALSQAVPAVSVAYSQKFLGVISSLGLAELVADARTLSEDAILQQLRHAFEDRVILQAKIRQKLPHVEQTILLLFNEIEDWTQMRLNAPVGSNSKIKAASVVADGRQIV